MKIQLSTMQLLPFQPPTISTTKSKPLSQACHSACVSYIFSHNATSTNWFKLMVWLARKKTSLPLFLPSPCDWVALTQSAGLAICLPYCCHVTPPKRLVFPLSAFHPNIHSTCLSFLLPKSSPIGWSMGRAYPCGSRIGYPADADVDRDSFIHHLHHTHISLWLGKGCQGDWVHAHAEAAETVPKVTMLVVPALYSSGNVVDTRFYNSKSVLIHLHLWIKLQPYPCLRCRVWMWIAPKIPLGYLCSCPITHDHSHRIEGTCKDYAE